MDDEQREAAREQFRYRCGYCGVHEEDAGATLTVDHYRPKVHEGSDDPANLVYCCHRCNEHKGSYWHEADPPHVRLLHPLIDHLAEHVQETDTGYLVGISQEGELFILRLRLNRPPLIAYRLNQHKKREADTELEAERQRVQELQAQIDALTAALARTDDDLEREGA
ncbi:MAG TPA: HNH endonuclease signature motif containing protein [Armatimonadota bacterium]|jgi:hypothetical protein|nr:HNH endonuclease signature motif containing protein [Armatimonadota bacterium]